LRSAPQDDFLHLTALGHIAVDVLNLDGRIIDQNANR